MNIKQKSTLKQVTFGDKVQGRTQMSESKSFLFSVFCLISFALCLGLFGYICYSQIRNNHYLNTNKSYSYNSDFPSRDVIKDDWLVNDDTLGGCDQLEPSITSTKTGYIVAWVDYRNGYSPDIYPPRPDIYVGRFDFNGVLIDSAIRVNDDSGSNYQWAPSLDADSVGNFVVVWEDERNGEKDIYGQRFNKNGVPIGSNFKVNDDTMNRAQHTPAIGVGLGGEFIVVWRDDRGSASDIYAQVYDTSGSAIGNNFIVNDDGIWNVSQCFPYVSKTPHNEFAVVWLDTRAGTGIYCQRYTKWGAPIGTNFEVTDNPDSTAPMRFPFIYSNLKNQTVIVWRDHREHDSYPNIYAQRYDSLWNPVGANFRVNSDFALAWHDAPSVVVDSVGNFVFVWSDGRNDFNNPDVYGQRYNAMGNPEGVNFKINAFSPGPQELTNPVIGVDPSSCFMVIWQDNSGPDRELLAQRYITLGSTPTGNNFSLIPDQGFSNQKVPKVAMSESGEFVVVWEDERGDKLGVFAQRYDSCGSQLGVNWQVNKLNRAAGFPSVAIDSAGYFTIVWAIANPSHIDRYEHIYGRKYTNTGIPVAPEFRVDRGPDCLRIAPSVAMDKRGNFVIAWEDYRNDTKCGNIYAQRYNSDCSPIDTNFIVDQTVGESSESPCVAMTSTGEFIIVWQEGKAGFPWFDIYGQRFNSAGSPVGTNFQISDSPVPQHQQIHPSVAIHDDGNIVVVWQDTRNYNNEIYDIYAQIYDVNGMPVGSNFKVNDNLDSTSHEFPSVAIHPQTKEFIVIWTDYRKSNPQIMAQKFDSLGVPLGGNFQINNSDVHRCNSHISSSRSISSNAEKIALVWADNRRLKGLDVYAKLVKWEFTSIEEMKQADKAFMPCLQVYPTPAFKKLTVKYNIPPVIARSEVTNQSILPYTILIYDRVGRVVTEFALPQRTPGLYTSQFDISTLSSGIYFITFKGPDVTSVTKKVIVCH